MVYQVCKENVGRNGHTKRDIGKWFVMIQGCTHKVKSREDGYNLLKIIK